MASRSPTEPIANANTARASFFVDLAGDYKFQLLCKDNENAECAPCTVDVHAVPTDDLHIQLVWDTPTVDVDLHLLRAGATLSWFSADDCHFQNRTPEWFTPSRYDDPRLDIDDTDGYGPENINVQQPTASPADQPYKIGVHYYSNDYIGATRATVRVYCMGTLAAEKGPVLLEKTNKWWDFGSIAWPGCNVTVNDPPPITDRSPSNSLFP
ncbi:MAG: hypothetical protein HYY84_19560 [Deltaproteobacteria bacterium]|nr:hypothetical protein [Deltaproteobacteria bacterium]